ncbi:MAG TPA: hypothetical protein VHX39_10890 [Acetobacteraceae bacterium]|nr:hypothetical protein [Acetobacteraceae bacterium]
MLGFLALVLVSLLAGFGALAFALGVAVDDPGGGDFTGDKAITGTLIADPYPMIVTDNDHHTILLSGGGKRGVQVDARPLDGKHVHATGAGVKRGDRDMLLVDQLLPVPGEALAAVREPLGTWRLTGEICDGKCSLGVMRPGNKAAHKACANVCLIGGVPPVFITTTPVLGTQYLLMGDPQDHTLPDALRDFVAITTRMDGTLERIGDALVFRTDVTKAIVP